MNLDVPTISKSRDHGELQDMYRRALAASWASHAAELPADQCVEDIFNGGDGWKHASNPNPKTAPRSGMQPEDSASDDNRQDHHPRRGHRRTHSGGSTTSQNTVTAKQTSSRIGHHKRNESHDTLDQSPSSQSVESSGESERGRTGFRNAHEVDEFDVRDDLVAWRLPDEVTGTVA